MAAANQNNIAVAQVEEPNHAVANRNRALTHVGYAILANNMGNSDSTGGLKFLLSAAFNEMGGGREKTKNIILALTIQAVAGLDPTYTQLTNLQEPQNGAHDLALERGGHRSDFIKHFVPRIVKERYKQLTKQNATMMLNGLKKMGFLLQDIAMMDAAAVLVVVNDPANYVAPQVPPVVPAVAPVIMEHLEFVSSTLKRQRFFGAHYGLPAIRPQAEFLFTHVHSILFDIAAVIGAIQVHTERLPVDLSAAGFFRTYKIINEVCFGPWKERFQNIADIEQIIRDTGDDKKKRIIDEGLSKCNTVSVSNNRWIEDSARFIQLNGEIITDAIDANDNVKTFSQQAPTQAQTPPRPMAAIAHQGNGGVQYNNTGFAAANRGGRGAPQSNRGAGRGGFQNNNNNNYSTRGGINNQHQLNNTPQGNNHGTRRGAHEDNFDRVVMCAHCNTFIKKNPDNVFARTHCLDNNRGNHPSVKCYRFGPDGFPMTDAGVIVYPSATSTFVPLNRQEVNHSM